MNEKKLNKLKLDIRMFNKNGILPKDHDVIKSKRRYWNYIEDNNGLEPLGNNANVVIKESLASTNYGARFAVWLQLEYPKLPEFSKELFKVIFEKKVSVKDAAPMFGMKRQALQYHVTLLKKKLAKDIGIRV